MFSSFSCSRDNIIADYLLNQNIHMVRKNKSCSPNLCNISIFSNQLQQKDTTVYILDLKILNSILKISQLIFRNFANIFSDAGVLYPYIL